MTPQIKGPSEKLAIPTYTAMKRLTQLLTHSQREAYMDLVENGGGGGRRQEVEEPQGM